MTMFLVRQEKLTIFLVKETNLLNFRLINRDSLPPTEIKNHEIDNLASEVLGREPTASEKKGNNEPAN